MLGTAVFPMNGRLNFHIQVLRSEDAVSFAEWAVKLGVVPGSGFCNKPRETCGGRAEVWNICERLPRVEGDVDIFS